MKQYILEIYENGYLDRIKRKWKVREKQNCDAKTSEKTRSLSAEKLASLFIIVFMGIISALFIMLMEFVTAYYSQKRRNQIDAPPQTRPGVEAGGMVGWDTVKPTIHTASTLLGAASK